MAIGTSSGSRTAIRCGQRAAPSGEGPTHMPFTSRPRADWCHRLAWKAPPPAQLHPHPGCARPGLLPGRAHGRVATARPMARGQPHNRQLRAWDGPWSDPKAADLLVPERLVGEEGDHHGGHPGPQPGVGGASTAVMDDRGHTRKQPFVRTWSTTRTSSSWSAVACRSAQPRNSIPRQPAWA